VVAAGAADDSPKGEAASPWMTARVRGGISGLLDDPVAGIRRAATKETRAGSHPECS
jgi:hypothetical protein